MELQISIILGFMIIGAIYALHAKDLLSAVIAMGIVGYGLVICFLLLLDSTREEEKVPFDRTSLVNTLVAFVVFAGLFYFFLHAIEDLNPLGKHTLGMAESYVIGALEHTGSVNLVTGVLFDFRAYDTLGEAVILYTAALGALTLLRMKGKKTD